MKNKITHTFEDIVNIENLLEAWREFIRGKRNRHDVQEFQFNLIDNIFLLHQDLANRTYKHGSYQAFSIWDPKPRSIHKASVRDRLVHHAVYRVLYPFFDKLFISDSFSCRLNKGTHKALDRFRSFAYTVSKNNTQTCWILKCDLKKFFATINHKTLITVLEKYIPDQGIIWLLKEIINSFSSVHPNKIFIKTLTSGIDFLGWVHFSDHRVLRTTTKKRMMRKIGKNPKQETLASYAGFLGHGNTYKIRINNDL